MNATHELKRKLEERRIWWHSQNLNEKPGDDWGNASGPMWQHGRAWLHLPIKDDEHRTRSIGVSWRIPTHFYHIGMDIGDCEEELQFSFACGLFALWIEFENFMPRAWRDRLYKKYGWELPLELEVSYHDGSVWWNLLTPRDSWDSKTPKWRNGSFNFMDFVFGRMKYSNRVYDERRVVIPMPEGNYEGTCKLKEATWTRPRWSRWPLTRAVLRADIEPDKPIPIPGKGENSWDCGEDATHSMTCAARTHEEAISKLVESCLSRRTRYGGANWLPEVKP